MSALLDEFDALAARAAEHGLRPLAMRIRLHQASVAVDLPTGRRDEVLGRLRVLETEARAAGLLYFADRAKTFFET